MTRLLKVSAVVGVMVAAVCARATEPDKLYSLEVTAPPVAAGSKGAVAIQIRPKGESYVHKEAPLKMSVTAKGLKLEKDQFGRPDAQRKDDGPRFEVPFTAEQAGGASLDATLTFFICTKTLCERQERTLNVPVAVK